MCEGASEEVISGCLVYLSQKVYADFWQLSSQKSGRCKETVPDNLVLSIKLTLKNYAIKLHYFQNVCKCFNQLTVVFWTTWEVNMQVNSCMENGQSSECIPFMCIFIDENTQVFFFEKPMNRKLCNS